MDFDLSDDQRMLKDSVDRLIADKYSFEQRKKYMAEPDGWSREDLSFGREAPFHVAEWRDLVDHPPRGEDHGAVAGAR